MTFGNFHRNRAKIYSVKKLNPLRKLSEAILSEERTIKRRADHRHPIAGKGCCAGPRAFPKAWDEQFDCGGEGAVKTEPAAEEDVRHYRYNNIILIISRISHIGCALLPTATLVRKQ